EQVVAGEDEQVVVGAGALEHEGDVADRAEAVLVRLRAVVVHGDPAAAGRPPLEVAGEARVRDHVDVARHLLDPIADPVHHRTPADRQELLGDRVGERPQPGGIAGREHDRPHAATSPASDSAYGCRCTPRSVTIAAIRDAGVTSNAGFRAAKRAVTSSPERSSIGMPSPEGVARSTVELGATT